MGILYENSLGVFLFVTLILGGGGAYLTGRAIAITWRPMWTLVWFTFLLALFVRFIHFSLFDGTLVTLHYLIVDFVILLGIAYAAQRITRANQMVSQYSWMYEKSGLFAWREKV